MNSKIRVGRGVVVTTAEAPHAVLAWEAGSPELWNASIACAQPVECAVSLAGPAAAGAIELEPTEFKKEPLPRYARAGFERLAFRNEFLARRARRSA